MVRVFASVTAVAMVAAVSGCKTCESSAPRPRGGYVKERVLTERETVTPIPPPAPVLVDPCPPAGISGPSLPPADVPKSSPGVPTIPTPPKAGTSLPLPPPTPIGRGTSQGPPTTNLGEPIPAGNLPPAADLPPEPPLRRPPVRRPELET
jgi:hypothetical protein